MDNPFRKRASENVLESEAFLQLVSDEPVEFVLENNTHGELFDRLVLLIGTPGSGKTTIGRLFEYRNLSTLNTLKEHDSYKDLAKVMVQFGAIVNERAYVLGARLVMDSEYRNIWELPYEPSLKHNLFLTLVQCRCVLLWLNALRLQGFQDNQISILTKHDSPAAMENIGTSDIGNLRKKAISVEDAVYRVVHALVPIPFEKIPSLLTTTYDPLSIISDFKIKSEDGSDFLLKPMILVDDAHELHSQQFSVLTDWLINRDIRAARWVMTRFDVATSGNKWILAKAKDATTPGRQYGRDYILLSANQITNTAKKRSFRSTANNIATRYLQLMPIFNRSKLTNLSSLLDESSPDLPNIAVEKLRDQINQEFKELSITKERVDKLNALIDNHGPTKKESPEVKLAMLRILGHRYAKRTPQQDFFAEPVDIDPKREITVDSSVMHGARIFLLHRFNRPFYYGFDSLVDSGGGNIEQFLKSADIIVSSIEAKLIRKKQANLDSTTQHKLINKIAVDEINRWSFPMSDKVKLLIEFISELAIEISLRPNAPLGDGANAFGVLRSDFDRIENEYPLLGQVLHYATGYNAITVIPEYNCKNQIWTLIELGGYPTIQSGLTFKRGGFVEGKISTLYEHMFGKA